MKQTLTKVLAGSAAAALLLPTLALAHENEQSEHSLKVRIEHRLDKAEHRDGDHEDRVAKNASSTAAAITKKAVRIQNAADVMLSFNARINALIASSSADVKTTLQAKFAQFQTAAGNAKVEAGKAITGAASVSASNSTTTNATILATAKTDLRDARGFLHDAKEAFFSVLRTLLR